ADAAADAAAEGKPRVGLGAVLDEALGAELLGSWIQILAQVDERDPGIHLDARGKLPARDGPGHGQRPLGGVDHRTQPQGLLDDGIEVGVVLSSRHRARTRGLRRSNSNANARPVAVVSCPAPSIVNSSSRSSASVIAWP